MEEQLKLDLFFCYGLSPQYINPVHRVANNYTSLPKLLGSTQHLSLCLSQRYWVLTLAVTTTNWLFLYSLFSSRTNEISALEQKISKNKTNKQKNPTTTKQPQDARSNLERLLPSLQPRNTLVIHENDLKKINVILAKGSWNRGMRIFLIYQSRCYSQRDTNSFSRSENKIHDSVGLWRKPQQSFTKNDGTVKSITILLMRSVKMEDFWSPCKHKH